MCIITAYCPSQIEMNKLILRCVNQQLLHCTLREYSSLSHYSMDTDFRPVTYCGALWILNHLPLTFSEQELVIQVAKKKSIHLNILKFNFPRSKTMSCWQHGMFFVGEGNAYCGQRLPWKMIKSNNKVVVKLTVAKYKAYSFTLFYSATDIKFFGNFSQIFEDNLAPLSMAKIVLQTLTPFVFVKVFVYYLYALPTNYIAVDIFSITSSQAQLRIHDGPGPLSNKIYDSESHHLPVNWQARSTAFAIYLRISLISAMISENSRLYYKTKTQEDSTFSTSYTNTSRESENIFYFGHIYFFKYIVHMRVNVFIFNGPDTITASIRSLCQYGGLWIYMYKEASKHLSFCETVYNLDLYAEYSQPVGFIFVWFSGYSHGRINITSSRTNCQTYYAETSAKLTGSTIMMDSTSFSVCGVFICPPADRHLETMCAVHLGPPDLGPVNIHVELRKTFTVCENPYTERNDTMSFSMYTSSSKNWPFSIFKDIIHQNYGIIDNTIKSFDYLHNSTIVLPHLCKINARRSQLTVIVEKSGCFDKSINSVQDDWLTVINNMPVLSGKCLFEPLVFIPSARSTLIKDAYASFIFLNSGNGQTKHHVLVDYVRCPPECRSYKYSTFIRNGKDQTIVEYTVNVGESTYTGYNHVGFKISILTLNTSCMCQLKIIAGVDKSILPTYTAGFAEKIETLQFYKKG